MSSVGVRELKNELSEYLDRVEAGEVVIVTRRGKPVARLVPMGISEGLARLMEEGMLTWSGKRPILPERIKLRGEGPTMSEILIEGRR